MTKQQQGYKLLTPISPATTASWVGGLVFKAHIPFIIFVVVVVVVVLLPIGWTNMQKGRLWPEQNLPDGGNSAHDR